VCMVVDTQGGTEKPQKATAPQPPVSRSSPNMQQHRVTSNANAVNSVQKLSPDVTVKDLPSRFDGEQSEPTDLDGRSSLSDARLPGGVGVMMVEHVRRKTGLSHSKSQLAVATVLNLLAEQVPSTERLVTTILDDIQHHRVCQCWVLHDYHHHYHFNSPFNNTQCSITCSVSGQQGTNS